MKRILILVAALTVAFGAPAFAGSVFEKANSSDYVTKAPVMLARGVTNIATSGVDIVEHLYKGTIEGKPVLGTVKGLGYGTYYALDRAGRGVLDVVGFLVPDYHGAPSTHAHEYFKFLNF